VKRRDLISHLKLYGCEFVGAGQNKGQKHGLAQRRRDAGKGKNKRRCLTQSRNARKGKSKVQGTDQPRSREHRGAEDDGGRTLTKYDVGSTLGISIGGTTNVKGSKNHPDF
jgi:hypothetical protein